MLNIIMYNMYNKQSKLTKNKKIHRNMTLNGGRGLPTNTLFPLQHVSF